MNIKNLRNKTSVSGLHMMTKPTFPPRKNLRPPIYVAIMLDWILSNLTLPEFSVKISNQLRESWQSPRKEWESCQDFMNEVLFSQFFFFYGGEGGWESVMDIFSLLFLFFLFSFLLLLSFYSSTSCVFQLLDQVFLFILSFHSFSLNTGLSG